MAGISLEDARAQSGNNAPVEPTSPSPTRGLTLEAARLEGDPLSAENVRPSLRSVVFHDDPLGEMAKGLKKGVGMAGQLADMALGLPGQAIRVGANIGGRLSALTQGASAEDAAWAGKAMADQVPRSLTNPVGTAMEALGYGKDYNENQVAHVLESVMGVVSKGGEWVEEATGKTLLKRDVEDLFETFMLSLGARGTAVGLDPKLKKLARPEVGDVPRAAGNLERYRGKPPPGGWRRPLEEPTMGEAPLPVPDVLATPDSRATSFTNRPAGGPAVWAIPRARQPVGEAVDLTNEPRVPTGEATEVPHIPTGEAIELPAEGIPVGEARQIGGAVGAKIADRMTAEREAAAFADAKRLAPETYKELKAKGLLPAVAGAGAAYAAMQALSDDDRDAVLAAVGGGFRPKPKQTLAQFSKTLAGSIREQVARTKLAVEQAAKTGQYQWDAGDVVYSPKTGRVMTILGRTITKKGEPRYFYEAGKEGEDGWSRGELIADKAHESLTLIAQAEKPDGGKLLSAAAAGGLTAYLAANPERRDDLIAAGILTGTVVKGKPGVDMKRVTALLGQKLYGDLSKMPVVASKELVQNAFDAIKTQLVNGNVREGQMAIGLNSADRSIMVADNGTGMTSEVLGKQFLTVAGTLKGSGRDSGGLGIAKLQFLFGSKAAEVYTLKEGKLSVLKTTGERLSAAMMEGGEQPDIHVFEGAEARRLFEEKYKEAYQLADRRTPPPTPNSGTVVKIVVPDDFTDTSTGAQKAIDFPDYGGSLPVLKSPLFENINVRVGRNGFAFHHSMGKDFDAAAHSHLFSVQFPWGKARIYATKDPVSSDSNNMNFLSNGLYQFEGKLAKDPKDNWSEPVPRTFYVDIEPAVRAEDPGYPFDLHRQGFTQSAARDFQLVQNYLNKLYEKDSLGDSASTMADVEYIDWAGRRTKVQGLDAAPLEEGMSYHIADQDKVEVRDGKLIVNGRTIPLLTPDEMSEARLDAQNYKVPEGTLDVSRPVLHDNMLIPEQLDAAFVEAAPYKDMPWEFGQRTKDLLQGPLLKFSDYARARYGDAFDKMNSQIGHLFLELRDRLVEVYKDDTTISKTFAADLKKFGVGVGYDTMYRGVNAKLPVDLMLVNPAAIIRMVKGDPGSNPLRASAALYGTMIHEITHVPHRGHGETSFIPAMAQLMADLASDPRATAIRTKLRDVITQHEAMLLDLNEVMTNVRQFKLAKTAGRNLSNESDFEAVSRGATRERGTAREGGPGADGPAGGVGTRPDGTAGIPNNGGFPTGPRGSQAGGINPELAAGLAAATISSAAVAWLSPRENRTKNAALAAAIVGLTAWGRSRSPAIRERVAEVFSGAEKVAGVLSTTLSNISPAITKRLRDHVRHELQATNEALNTIGPFVRELRRLPEAVAERLNAALLTGDPRAIREAIVAAGSRVIQQEYEQAIRPLLDQVGRDLHATGRLRQLKLGMGMEYYPRIVTDLKGLLEALGREEGSVLQRMLDQAEHNAERRTNMPLSDLERTLVIGQYLKARNTGAGRPGFLKPRTVGEVTPDLARFYAPASESLPIYLRSVMKEIERARFFGEDLVRESETGVTNLEASIGNVVEGERARGNITDAQIETLRELLRSRFGPGEKAMSGNLQLVRNLTNVGLLGNITSSVTQAGDILLAYYAHGLVPTIKGASKVLTRDAKRATVRDLGLVDHITEEVTGGARTPLIVMGREITSAKFVEKTFKMSGFSAVDQLGKAVSINAALVKYQGWAKSPAGIARIREKYGRAYGDDFDGLVRDLRAGELTENVRSLLFSELSDLQPISKLEVPKAYLDNPNGRIIYQLRTYTIKMMDIARRDGFQEIARGNVSRGVGNLLRLGIVLGISGATTGFVVNWMLGKTNKLDWGDIPENALKTMGWSSFVLDKARKGEPISAIAGAVAPPWQMWDRILRQDPAAVQYLPPLGKIYYYHELGGKERANAWAEKQDRLSSMSDAEYAEMLRRREERKRTKESRQ